MTMGIVFAAASAEAQLIQTYKHDQFDESIYGAVNEMNGKILQNEPGFVAGEAFGALFRPGKADYPLKILGIDVIFGGPKAYPDLATNIELEVYLDAGVAAMPANTTPDFKISSTEFYNADTNEFGIPIKGNIAYQFDFNEDDEKGAPPGVEAGNILIMIRFNQEAYTLTSEWGTPLCEKLVIPGLLETCGCQPVSMILDNALTPLVNVMHIVHPIGTCSGAKKWFFFEDVQAEGKKLNGDVIIRMRGERSARCVPDCTDKDCGDDLCGGSCGTCDIGTVCEAQKCVEDTCAPNCPAGAQCGPDGCGGSCGVCDAGNVCESHKCGPPDSACTCDEKDCGDNGCGVSCGFCAEGYECTQSKCVETGGTDTGGEVPTDELELTSISPATGFGDEQTPVSILGKGFTDGIKVKLGGTDLIAVSVTGSEFIEATVPKGIAAGMYTLIAIDESGQTAQLPDAFEIKDREEPAPACGDGMCNPGEDCSLCPGDCGQCPAETPKDEGCGCDLAPSSAPSGPMIPPGAAVILLLALGLFVGQRRLSA